MRHSALFERAKNREGSSGGAGSRDVEAKRLSISGGMVKMGLFIGTSAILDVLALYCCHQNDSCYQELTHPSEKSLQPLSVCVLSDRQV
jgi:hypothetical protein